MPPNTLDNLRGRGIADHACANVHGRHIAPYLHSRQALLRLDEVYPLHEKFVDDSLMLMHSKNTGQLFVFPEISESLPLPAIDLILAFQPLGRSHPQESYKGEVHLQIVGQRLMCGEVLNFFEFLG